MSFRPSTSSGPVPAAAPALGSRRNFLREACTAVAALGWLPEGPVSVARADDARSAPLPGQLPFKLSLSQRSLAREFGAGRLDPLDFPRVASSFGIDAVEYDGQLYDRKLRDKRYLSELKRRAAGEGVWSKLIIVTGQGDLGAPKEKIRRRVVDNHERWLEAAAFLGCHALCVTAASQGSEDDQVSWVSDGLRRLCKLSEPYGIDILIDNQGGFAAQGSWVSELLSAVGHPRCGSRPSFGSAEAVGATGAAGGDRYQGVRDLMPTARAVGAKAYDFDERGEETHINYAQMLAIVSDAGYRGHVAIEYEGTRLGEQTGIARAKQLLERVRGKMASRAGRPG